MSSIYINLEVQYTNYLPTPQTYNTNMVDRSHAIMSMLCSHVNMHNSYSSTDMSRWCNHNVYITEHVDNIHNGYVPPYSFTELASHCTPQTHMPMNNSYSQADMRSSANFSQSLYTAPDSIRMEIAPNLASTPHVTSNVFHSASPIYSRVEESLANTPTSGTNRSDFDKGSNTELTIEDLLVEYCEELKVQWRKMDEAFMARYDLMS
jgi:hypothetical protein